MGSKRYFLDRRLLMIYRSSLSSWFRFGRRPLLLVSYVSSLIFAVLSAFSTSYIMFVIMRFFTGMSLAGISIIAIALSKEILSVRAFIFVVFVYSVFLDVFLVLMFLQMWNGAALNAGHSAESSSVWTGLLETGSWLELLSL